VVKLCVGAIGDNIFLGANVDKIMFRAIADKILCRKYWLQNFM